VLPSNFAAEKFVHPHIFLRLGGQKDPIFPVAELKSDGKLLRLSQSAKRID
jgi:hypothetical protein